MYHSKRQLVHQALHARNMSAKQVKYVDLDDRPGKHVNVKCNEMGPYTIDGVL